MAHPTLQLPEYESYSLTPFETRQIESLSVQKYRIVRAATVLPTGSQTWKRREEHAQTAVWKKNTRIRSHSSSFSFLSLFVSVARTPRGEQFDWSMFDLHDNYQSDN